jgi:cation diffusion facilitator CzcD-associated flavoprotein CzcO
MSQNRSHEEIPLEERVALLARYEHERLKRLRPEGIGQYVEAERLLGMSRGPFTADTSRAPVKRRATFTFVGGGLAGLITCARLRESGLDDLMMIEKGGDFGGTWYWNRYPGAQCDTASMVYLPLLEETGHIPSERYAHGPEIFGHCQRIGSTFGLYERALFHTTVTRVEWDETDKTWRVFTDHGDEIVSRFLSIGTGQFHIPKVPNIPGIGRFQGRAFHSSQWDYDYTGGDPSGGAMTGLTDKRVAIIGTGATAVQCVPHLARAAGELLIFQRTPSAVDERGNEAIDRKWFRRVATPGWQKRWMLNFVECRERWDSVEDLVNDGWTAISRRVREKLSELPPEAVTPDVVATTQETCDIENMHRIRRRVDREVHDPNTAERLKAWYGQFCKRPCFHDDYLQTFNRQNVRLIDTDGKGITAFTDTGVIAGGVEHPLDCIVFATGFRTDPRRMLPDDLRIVGSGGVELREAWSEGMKSLFGVFVAGFPNLFLIQPAQGANLLSNIPHNFVDSAATVSCVVHHMLKHGLPTFYPVRNTQDEWISKLLAGKRRLALRSCIPGTFNNEGKPDDHAAVLNVGNPAGPLAHFNMMQAWRESSTFEGLRFGAT